MKTQKNGSVKTPVLSGEGLGAGEVPESLQTTKEAAAFLKVSETHLRHLTSEGKIPHFKFGRQNRYRMKDLLNLIQPRNQRG